MDANLSQRRAGLDQKVPDIRKTLDMVKVLLQRRVRPFILAFISFANILLQEGKQKAILGDDDDDGSDGEGQPLKTTFELNDTLYAEAELEESDVVYLWLGVRLLSYLLFPPYPR
jgi:hypothetical protein